MNRMEANGLRPNRTTGFAQLAEACAITDEMHQLAERQSQLARRRRSLWLRANRNSITYVEIGQNCGLSQAVIDREIRKAKQETRSAALARRGSRHPFARVADPARRAPAET